MKVPISLVYMGYAASRPVHVDALRCLDDQRRDRILWQGQAPWSFLGSSLPFRASTGATSVCDTSSISYGCVWQPQGNFQFPIDAELSSVGGFAMVIYAAATFCCRHRYVTTIEHEQLMFVCEQCHHRTELLCLDRWTPDRRVVTFALPDAGRVYIAAASDDSAA